jgi:glycosyltransferase involved in cell wall biosynthesis
MATFDLPVREALRLPGETQIAWAVFDMEWYRTTYSGTLSSLPAQTPRSLLAYYLREGQRLGHSPNRYFHEAWHRQTYKGIAGAVEAEQFPSAFDAYCRTGNADRSPHWLFDELSYRRRYPDLTDDVLADAGLANGYDHFLQHGDKEGRVGHVLLDPAFYLAHLDDAERAVAAEMGPFRHFITVSEHGGGVRETGRYFGCAWYLQRYPDVADAIARGEWQSALEHYLCNDTPTAFDPLPDFSEDWYLTGHPGLRAAVEGGAYRNGYAHFLRHGTIELRSPAPHIDLRWYAEQEAVRESLLAGEADHAFAHWMSIGKPAVRPSAPPLDERVTDSQARSLFRQQAAALLPAYGWAPLRFGFAGEPALSVVMVADGALAETLATLTSLRNNTSAAIELLAMVAASDPDDGDIARFVTGATIQRLDAAIDPASLRLAGLACARAPVVLCLSAGTTLLPGAIDAALRRMNTDTGIGAVGGKELHPNGSLRAAGYVVWNDGRTHAYLAGESPLLPEANFARAVHFCGSAFLMVRTALAIAAMDAGAAPPATDNAAADLCLRLAEAGHRTVFDPAVMVQPWNDDPAGPVAVRPDDHAAFLAGCYEADGRALIAARFADTVRRRVLFIEDTIPLRKLGSGFVRANDLIATMAELGFAATVFPVNGCLFGLANIYADMPDTVEAMHDRDLSRLAEFLRLRQGVYDTIWVSRTHNMDRIRPILDRVLAGDPNPPRIILDTEAVGAARQAALAALEGRDFDLDAALRREFAQADICHTVVAVSEPEAATLRELGCPDVRVIGHMRRPSPTERPFARRSGMLFAGAIHRMDSPNYDSLCWFVDAVLPLVEKSLGWETRLTIAGYTAAGVDLDRFRGHPRITLRGAVADLEPLYASHRLFVAPTRFAAGAPYKVHEAASFGLPVVVTDLLRRQLGWTDGQELLSADATDPARFAAAIVALYRNEALWTRLREAALARLARDNSPEDYAASVASVLGPVRLSQQGT